AQDRQRRSAALPRAPRCLAEWGRRGRRLRVAGDQRPRAPRRHLFKKLARSQKTASKSPASKEDRAFYFHVPPDNGCAKLAFFTTGEAGEKSHCVDLHSRRWFCKLRRLGAKRRSPRDHPSPELRQKRLHAVLAGDQDQERKDTLARRRHR